MKYLYTVIKSLFKLLSLIIFDLELSFQSNPDYQIYPNSLEYIKGKLRIIQADDRHVYVGAKSMVFVVGKAMHSDIRSLLVWHSNSSQRCLYGDQIYIKFVSRNPLSQRVVEMCGSDGCQFVCQNFNRETQRYGSLHNGFYMIPANVNLSAQYIFPDGTDDVIAALPSDLYDAAHIVRHRSRTPSFVNPVDQSSSETEAGTITLTAQQSFSTSARGNVHFVAAFEHSSRFYFVLRESASEMLNYYSIFHSRLHTADKNLPTTRIGRICKNDEGVRPPKRLFTSFLRATLGCELNDNSKFSGQSYTYATAVHRSRHDPDRFSVMFVTAASPSRHGDAVAAPLTTVALLCRYSLADIESQLDRSSIAVLRKSDYDSASYWTKQMPNSELIACEPKAGDPLTTQNWLMASKMMPTSVNTTTQRHNSSRPTPNSNRFRDSSDSTKTNFDVSHIQFPTNTKYGDPLSMDIMESLFLDVHLPKEYGSALPVPIELDLVFVGTSRGYIGRAAVLRQTSENQLRTRIPEPHWWRYRLKPAKDGGRGVMFDHFLTVHSTPVRQLVVDRLSDTITAVGDSFLERVPAAFCTRNCWKCQRNFDPFCHWNPLRRICEIRSLFTSQQQISSHKNRPSLTISNCDGEEARKTSQETQPPAHSQSGYDSFWLVFSLALVVSILVIVVAVSLALRSHSAPHHCTTSSTAPASSSHRSVHGTRFHILIPSSSSPPPSGNPASSLKRSLILENRLNIRRHISAAPTASLLDSSPLTTTIASWRSCEARLDSGEPDPQLPYNFHTNRTARS